MALLPFVDGLFEDEERSNDDENGIEHAVVTTASLLAAHVIALCGVHHKRYAILTVSD